MFVRFLFFLIYLIYLAFYILLNNVRDYLLKFFNKTQKLEYLCIFHFNFRSLYHIIYVAIAQHFKLNTQIFVAMFPLKK